MKNQCDGCIRKLPIRDGIHWDGDEMIMVCEAEKYEEESDDRSKG